MADPLTAGFGLAGSALQLGAALAAMRDPELARSRYEDRADEDDADDVARAVRRYHRWTGRAGALESRRADIMARRPHGWRGRAFRLRVQIATLRADAAGARAWLVHWHDHDTAAVARLLGGEDD